jgi:hypothetical protein
LLARPCYAKFPPRETVNLQPRKDNVKKTATRVGQYVSVDLLKPPIPGLIAQMSGWITGKQYWYAAVYVDHTSRFGYVHLQKTQSVEETIKGKRLFEMKASALGIRVEHYHADNGVFVSKAWKADCDSKRQGFSYSGVNAHFQSGIAERWIRELQDSARVLLIHAQRRWPTAITPNLWPYVIHMSSDAINEGSLRFLKGRCQIEVFSHGQIKAKPRKSQHFGCPVYVLQSALQQGKSIQKWEERSHVRVYIGWSPFHARSIALILNITTGCVSPQFHVQFDPRYQTISPHLGGRQPISKWQSICGFTDKKGKNEDDQLGLVMPAPDPQVL